MSIPYTIRLLGANDQALYRQARLECLFTFPDRFGSTYEEESSKPELYFETLLGSNNTDHFMLGAFEEEKCIGLCGFIRESRNRTRHRGELVQMYVHPEYQGQGIAGRLIQHTIDKAFSTEGIEQIVLSAVADNERAVALYGRYGFEVYGRAKKYFRKKDGSFLDQVFMILYKH